MTEPFVEPLPVEGPGASHPALAAASLYRNHWYAARHLADLACAIESEAEDKPDAELLRRHRAYVIGTILTTTAFLEASINELYLEVQDRSLNGGPGGQRRVLAVPAHFWSEAARPPILHKYQLALVVADAEPFDESRPTFRDADGLIALRDALVHGRPDWRDRHGRRQNLERRLRTKFAHNRLASPADPEFPDRLLGAGCASWTVRVAERFSDEFCQRMAIPARGAGPGRERAGRVPRHGTRSD
jgi:hypothetical protein